MQSERPHFARRALTGDGWQQDVLVTVGADGLVAEVQAGAKQGNARAVDLLLPGMGNVHSHSFQWAMAGMTEISSCAGNDNFWSWRRVMYAFTKKLQPEYVEIITRALYIEMLKQGYTGVGEFHYLHHQPDGTPYDNRCEMSDRIIAAAQDAGIHLTHLPVMYETANFGGIPAREGQERFVHNAESYLRLIEALRGKYHDIVLGVAPHSLRAVPPESLSQILEALPGLGLGECPIHMHVAEQVKEVEDCIAWSGQRPVEWLFDFWDVDARWCLIHATHINHDEVRRMGAWKAVAGLCPVTEANLGDGIFPAEFYLENNGRFGIGSDSQVGLSPWQELRQLEYAQRLMTRRRNVLGDASVGRNLFSRALAGGSQALGMKSGKIAKGYRADMIGLTMQNPLLESKRGDGILDTLIFAGITPEISDVWVAGKQVIENGRHAREEETTRAFSEVMKVISGWP